MDVIEAIHSRRSVRVYSAQPVERELIEDLIWDAAQAPPPFAGQVPWTFNVIRHRAHRCIRRACDTVRPRSSPRHRRGDLERSRRFQGLLGRPGGGDHLGTGRGLLPRRPAAAPGRPCSRARRVLGRRTDAMASDTRGEGRDWHPRASDPGLRDLPRPSRINTGRAKAGPSNDHLAGLGAYS
jgi:Nitroreductase family